MGRDVKDRKKDFGEEKEREKGNHGRGERDVRKERDDRKRRRHDVVEVKEKERHRKGRDRNQEREREREVEEERDRKRRKKNDDESMEREEREESSKSKEHRREVERGRERESEKEEREREQVREKARDTDREKHKEKDREKSRDRRRKIRDRERGRERDIRSGEGERDCERKRRRKDEDAARGDLKVKKEADNDEDPEEEQKRLDDEIDKRRRRVQEWQELRRRKQEEDRQNRGLMQVDADVVSSSKIVKKTWTLEGEDSDDENDAVLPKSEGTAEIRVAAFTNGDLVKADLGGNGIGSSEGKFAKVIPKLEESEEKIAATIHTVKVKQKVEEEEVDPLDAYMNSIAIPEVDSADAVAAEAPESKPPFANRASKKGQECIKSINRNTETIIGRILPEDDSASDDEDDGEGKVRDEADDELLEGVKKTKAEKLAIVDHSMIQYPSFRKKFYIEVKEISRMTPEGAAAYRKDLELKIRGKDVPRPLKAWNQTGLNSKVLDVIKKAGFEKPMPIQAQAFPIIMSGRDCIGIAKTGSGKTLAFVLPMLRHIMGQSPLQQGDGPIGLIIAPTRELVQQIYNDIRKFSKVLGLICVPVYGGLGFAQQISDLKRGAEIVVCTPGRMMGILCTSAGKITNLRRVTYLVMDEADRMFDMGFEPLITRIVQNTRPDRQTLLFSATFPRQVEVLARKVLTRPVEIQIGGRSVVNCDIAQTVEIRPESERFLRLLELLGEWCEKGKVLVFVHSQERCDSLFKELLKAGYPCLSLHGGKDQTDRESTITDFKTSVCNLMIATSVAARGLDVKELELVVNYDVPNHYEEYVHRVGRTGRAGRKGCSVTFVSREEERYAPDLVKALELSEQPIPEDLKRLADDFMLKVKQGSEQAHGSGYGGRGFKFNAEEDEALKAVKKAQAREYGFEEEEDEIDLESDDEGIRKAGGEMSQLVNLQAAAKAGLPSTMNPALAQLQAALASMAQAAAANQAVAAGAGAAAMAAAYNRWAKIQADAVPESYKIELEINDFPQHARWKVTHRDALGQISECTGAAITTRGQYFPLGKVPGPGERKLFLLIEGPTETSVKKAKAEVKHILEESTSAAIRLLGPAQPGKYSVV